MSASLICSGCILAPVPLTKRVSGAVGAPQQKKIDLTFVKTGKTPREEVAQKLAWADSGIKDDHLFLARWTSSGSGWVWQGGDSDWRAFRDWTDHNFLVTFDDAGLVKTASDVSALDLIPSLQKWVAQSNSPLPAFSGPVELKISLHRTPFAGPPSKLILSTDSFEFHDVGKPKHSFQIHPSMIKGLAPGVDAQRNDAPDLAVIGVTILFQEKTPAGRHISFNLSSTDLLVLLKYVHVTSGSPHAP